ncbi:hypothetical protein DSECCO2_607000 [anaerobic digester metagenome]
MERNGETRRRRDLHGHAVQQRERRLHRQPDLGPRRAGCRRDHRWFQLHPQGGNLGLVPLLHRRHRLQRDLRGFMALQRQQRRRHRRNDGLPARRRGYRHLLVWGVGFDARYRRYGGQHHRLHPGNAHPGARPVERDRGPDQGRDLRGHAVQQPERRLHGQPDLGPRSAGRGSDGRRFQLHPQGGELGLVPLLHRRYRLQRDFLGLLALCGQRGDRRRRSGGLPARRRGRRHLLVRSVGFDPGDRRPRHQHQRQRLRLRMGRNSQPDGRANIHGHAAQQRECRLHRQPDLGPRSAGRGSDERQLQLYPQGGKLGLVPLLHRRYRLQRNLLGLVALCGQRGDRRRRSSGLPARRRGRRHLLVRGMGFATRERRRGGQHHRLHPDNAHPDTGRGGRRRRFAGLLDHRHPRIR